MGMSTTSGAASGETVVYVRQETRVERYARMSNEQADEAVKWLELGNEGLFIACASSADSWARLRVIVSFLELTLEKFP